MVMIQLLISIWLLLQVPSRLVLVLFANVLLLAADQALIDNNCIQNNKGMLIFNKFALRGVVPIN